MSNILTLIKNTETQRLLNPVDTDFLLCSIKPQRIKSYTRFEFSFLCGYDEPTTEIKQMNCIIRSKGGNETTVQLDHFFRNDSQRTMTAITESNVLWDENSMVLIHSYSTQRNQNFYANKWVRINLSDDQMKSDHLDTIFQDPDFHVFPKVQDVFWQCQCGLIHAHNIPECKYCKMEFIDALRMFTAGYEETIRDQARKIPIELNPNLDLNGNINQHIQKLIGFGFDSEVAKNAVDFAPVKRKYDVLIEKGKLRLFIDKHPIEFDFDESIETNLKDYQELLLENGFSKPTIQSFLKEQKLLETLTSKYHKDLNEIKKNIRNELENNPIKFKTSVPFSDAVNAKVTELCSKGYPQTIVYSAIMETDPERHYREQQADKASFGLYFILIAAIGILILFFMAGGN